MTLYDAVRAAARSRPSACAVRTTAGESLTYPRLVDRCDRIAGGLASRGVREGQAVATVLRNSVDYVALILAVARIGARYVPLMSNFDAAHTRTALARTRPALVVTDGHRVVDAGGVPVAPIRALAASAPLEAAGARPHTGVFRTLWTSGSTGFPKLMAWRQDKFLAERRRWLADTGMLTTDVYLCRHTLDVAHATDLHMFAALLSGAELVLARQGASPAELLRDLVDTRATVMSALPAHWAGLARVAASCRAVDLSRLRRPLCGGAYLSPDVVRRCAEVLGIRIRQIYGSTEFGLALGDMDDVVQAGTGMRPVRGVAARLAPLSTSEQESPDVGELVLRSPCTSEGYVDNPEANARTFRGDEFWTGDVALRGPDGRYRILGRVSEALRGRTGTVLAPALDEEIVRTGLVAEAVCLATHPEAYGDEVHVVLSGARRLSEEDTADAVRALLDRHGLAATVRFAGAIPRTPVGKVDKALLRQDAALEGAYP